MESSASSAVPHLMTLNPEGSLLSLSALPDPAIIVRPDGTIALVNAQAEELLGYLQEDLQGKPLEMLIPERFRESHRMAQTSYFDRLSPRAMDSGRDFYILRRDRTEVPVDISLGPVEMGTKVCVLAVIRDLSERKKLQDTLREQLEFKALIADLSSTLINVPSGNVDAQINQSLKRVVEFLGLDNLALYEFSDDGQTLNPTYSHDPVGPPPPLDLANRFPWYASKLRAGETVVLARLPDDLPVEAVAERQFCQEARLRSHAAIPLTVAGLNLCVLAPAMFRTERSWPAEIVQGLRVVGEVFANALARKRADQRFQSAFVETLRLKERLEAEVTYLQKEGRVGSTFDAIIGQSDELKRLLFRVQQVAPGNTTVLILGETGTGKGLVAAAIHNLSPRKENPLITVNCASLPSNLIESELFGREKGAFTGAQAKQLGRFEVADHSTIFLDEIGELPLELQAKLLRVVQDGEFERLGSSKTVKVDVRIVAATNRNLEEEISTGRFRRDLYYRLNVFPITLPPLRARTEDIPLLVSSFVERLNKKLGKQITTIPAGIMKRLQGYPWPGNVRELESIIERSVIVSTGSVLHLAEELVISSPKEQNGSAPAQEIRSSAGESLAKVEREHILEVLASTKWRVEGKRGAAAALGLKPSTLRARMRKLGISR